MKTKEATWQEQPTYTNRQRGPCCLLKEEAVFWALGRLTREHQEPLRTKILTNIKTKKSPAEDKEPEHLVKTWNQPIQNKAPLPDPILTNPRLGPKQLPTHTVWMTKGNLETPWQQQRTLSVKQQEPWQKAEAMSQSPRFSSWTLIVQRHPQGRYTLRTQHCQTDKNQVKNQLKKGPIFRHPDAQEIGQFREQTRCSPSLFPLFSNFTKSKSRNTQARQARGNALDHPKPRQIPNRWETLQRTQGPMQNSEHPRNNQQAMPQQDEPKHFSQKCIQSSLANPASIWSLPMLPAHARPVQQRKDNLPQESLPPPAPENRGHPGSILARNC